MEFVVVYQNTQKKYIAKYDMTRWQVRIAGYIVKNQKRILGMTSQDIGISDERKSIGTSTVSSDVVNGLALQLVVVLLCMFVGKVLFTSLAPILIHMVLIIAMMSFITMVLLHPEWK